MIVHTHKSIFCDKQYVFSFKFVMESSLRKGKAGGRAEGPKRHSSKYLTAEGCRQINTISRTQVYLRMALVMEQFQLILSKRSFEYAQKHSFQLTIRYFHSFCVSILKWQILRIISAYVHIHGETFQMIFLVKFPYHVTQILLLFPPQSPYHFHNGN